MNHQRRSNEESAKTTSVAQNATVPMVAGAGSADIETNIIRHAQPVSTSKVNAQNRHVVIGLRFVFWAKVWLVCAPPLVASLTFWLACHFFHSLHQWSHLGLTIIAVASTTAMALNNVIGCWKSLSTAAACGVYPAAPSAKETI
jgi:hypothetical protein